MYFGILRPVCNVKVPDGVSPGIHKLTIIGIVNHGSDTAGEVAFRNTTTLIYDAKYVSMFIETDKPLYFSEQTS